LYVTSPDRLTELMQHLGYVEQDSAPP